MPRLTFQQRELPILDAVVEALDDGVRADVSHIEAKTGLDPATIQAGIRALLTAGYITQIVDRSSLQGSSIGAVVAVSGAARQVVGTWPSPEHRADELVAILRELANRVPDQETKGRLRTVAEQFGGMSRDLRVDVMAAVVSKQLGA
jgi:DNA-binding transcriptional ArsR family regulator